MAVLDRPQVLHVRGLVKRGLDASFATWTELRVKTLMLLPCGGCQHIRDASHSAKT